MAKSKSYNQEIMWEEHTLGMSPESIVDNIRHPSAFQTELSAYLNDELGGKGSVIEAGCESGVTSFLLNCDKRCFLDLNSQIIEKVKSAHLIFQPERDEDIFVAGDLFNMPFEDNTFDVCFNAGVLEHFSSDEIVCALREMKRVVKKSGLIVVAIPNHYCGVYRSAYLYGLILDKLGIRKWEWPRENKYYDLRREIKKAGLLADDRMTLSKDSIWNWWGGRRYLLIRTVFRLVDMIKPFDGYLTVLPMRKE